LSLVRIFLRIKSTIITWRYEPFLRVTQRDVSVVQR